ncbi:MAG: hypothetical protein CXZ00_16450 [Acidobacteria bacterium]|nr:MAG: hypothetical protein CXZ00_16450 [Acidobacteriota bacterium]
MIWVAACLSLAFSSSAGRRYFAALSAILRREMGGGLSFAQGWALKDIQKTCYRNKNWRTKMRKCSVITIMLLLFVTTQSFASANELYRELRKVEGAVQVGVNSIELKRLLYTAAQYVNEMGLTEEDVKLHINKPRPTDYLFLAFTLYRQTSNLMIEGNTYIDQIQKSWSIASNMLNNYKRIMSKKHK